MTFADMPLWAQFAVIVYLMFGTTFTFLLICHELMKIKNINEFGCITLVVLIPLTFVITTILWMPLLILSPVFRDRK